MRTREEIDQEIAHIEYGRSLLDGRLAAAKQERDLLREDAFAKATATKRMAEFFKAHSLYIVEVHTGARTKDHYDIAKQIWRARRILIPFAKRLHAHRLAPFSYPTAGIPLDGVNSIKNLCDVLAAGGWLKYSRREDGFEIVPSIKGAQARFLNYGWSEEVTLYLLDKALKTFTGSRHLKYKLFWDVMLKRIDPATNHPVDMQLDLVAEVDDRFYVFETKSGPVLNIDKWVDRARLFGDKKNRFITCTANEALDPRIFDPYRLFALATLEAQFAKMLEEDFAPKPADCKSSPASA